MFEHRTLRDVRSEAAPRTRRERLQYIQAARVVAIFLVVLSHTRFLFLPSDPVWSNKVLLLVRNANVIFIFFSGFLFQHLSADFRYFAYLMTKVRNVVIPYLICSIPALFMIFSGMKHINDDNTIEVGKSPVELGMFLILTGSHLTPYWFIPVMMIFFATSPLLLAFDRQPWLYLMLPVLFGISFVLSRSPGDASPIHNAIFYLPAYLSGMCLAHFQGRVMPLLARWYLLLATSIFLPLLVDMRGFGTEGMYLISKLLFCLAVFGSLYRFISVLPPSVGRLGDMSFGVFFVHQYVIAALEKVQHKLPLVRPTGVVAFLFAALAVTAVSLAIVRLVQLVAKHHSRQLVGA